MTRSKSKQQQGNAIIKTDVNKAKRQRIDEPQQETALIESNLNEAKRQRIDDQSSQVKKSQTKSKQRSNSNRTRKYSMVLCLPPSLRKFEMIWAHVRGYSLWPGIIEEEMPNGRFRIHFFGDYTRCDVTKSKIIHMMEGFNTFSTVEVRSPQLNKAIREAAFFVFDEERKSCPICDMLLLKISQSASKAIL